jgi:hypothetical protein
MKWGHCRLCRAQVSRLLDEVFRTMKPPTLKSMQITPASIQEQQSTGVWPWRCDFVDFEPNNIALPTGKKNTAPKVIPQANSTSRRFSQCPRSTHLVFLVQQPGDRLGVENTDLMVSRAHPNRIHRGAR